VSSSITIRPISSAVEIEAAATLAAGTSPLRPESEFVALFTRDCAQPEHALLLGAFGRASLIGYARVAYFERPDDAPVNCALSGWYLLGVVVHPKWVRQGLATRLTTERLAWAAARSSEIFYLAKPDNVASIAMHRKLGFQETARDVFIPPALSGLTLFHLSLASLKGGCRESTAGAGVRL
jgi:ribosomal protein S18 acetylase RimI-like enzyme